jgi:hypothetical protein
MAIVHISAAGVITRTVGDIPNVTKAPHDQSLLEQLGISPFSTADAFCAKMAQEVRESRIQRGANLDTGERE